MSSMGLITATGRIVGSHIRNKAGFALRLAFHNLGDNMAALHAITKLKPYKRNYVSLSCVRRVFNDMFARQISVHTFSTC